MTDEVLTGDDLKRAAAASPFAVQLVPIDSIMAHEQNVNQSDVGAVATAIATGGFHGSCILQAPDKKRKVPRIIVGHGRWRALRMLQQDGFTHPDGQHETYEELAARVPLPPVGFVPAQSFAMDDTRALQKLIADNRASALSSTDDAALAALLTELAGNDDLFGTLYDGSDLDELIVQVNEAAAGHGFGARAGEDMVECPSCGARFVPSDEAPSGF